MSRGRAIALQPEAWVTRAKLRLKKKKKMGGISMGILDVGDYQVKEKIHARDEQRHFHVGITVINHNQC